VAHFVCAVVVLMAWQTNLAGSRTGKKTPGQKSWLNVKNMISKMQNQLESNYMTYLEQINLGGLAPEELEVLELVQQLSGTPAPGKKPRCSLLHQN